MRSYTQLTRDERYQIYALRKAGHSQKEIAEVLGRSPSTINRELRRNRGLKGYLSGTMSLYTKKPGTIVPGT